MIKEDKKVIKEFKEGNVDAFESLYYRYNKKLYRFALGLTKDHDIATEIVQEVFVNLWEKRHQVTTSFNFENYIFTITYNSIRGYFRKKSIENKVKDYFVQNAPEALSDTDGSLIYSELLEMANRYIEKMPAQRKRVYKLNKQEGLKIKEIACSLNISTRTAETHLSKALQFLKEELNGISLQMLIFYYLFIC
ncbi:MAG: RNA polymerase sigma-70 factor [Bacteroidota bacterium]